MFLQASSTLIKHSVTRAFNWRLKSLFPPLYSSLHCSFKRKMSVVKKALMTSQEVPIATGGTKVTVVGCGQVGMACAFAMVTQRIINELAIVDMDGERLEGETMDLQHGATFFDTKVYCSTEYDVTQQSKVCVVTAGVRQKEGETRLELLKRNVEVFKNVIPPLVKNSPDTMLLIVSNPVDIMTYVSWKLSGLPQNRVIGSGTTLDSSRFRFFIAERLCVAPKSVHGYVIGEHGDSSVPVWSGVNVAGVRLRDVYPDIGTECDQDGWIDIHKKVVSSAYEVIKRKGYTNWGIGLSVAHIVSAILGNTQEVLPVSTFIKGCKHGTDKETFLSLPCVIGESGVMHIIKQPLTDDEKTLLHKSANVMYELQKDLGL